MEISRKLSLDTGRRYLKIVLTVNGVSLVKGLVESVAHINAILNADTVFLIDDYSEIVVSALLLEEYIPQNET
jgi:hypothetical protein